MPQAEVRVLGQLRTEQTSKVEHLRDLGSGLDRARPFNSYIVDCLAWADAQDVDQVTGDKDS